jgi:hypothetical protein
MDNFFHFINGFFSPDHYYTICHNVYTEVLIRNPTDNLHSALGKNS